MVEKTHDEKIQEWNDEQVRIDDAAEAKANKVGRKLAADPSYLKMLGREPLEKPAN